VGAATLRPATRKEQDYSSKLVRRLAFNKLICNLLRDADVTKLGFPRPLEVPLATGERHRQPGPGPTRRPAKPDKINVRRVSLRLLPYSTGESLPMAGERTLSIVQPGCRCEKRHSDRSPPSSRRPGFEFVGRAHPMRLICRQREAEGSFYAVHRGASVFLFPRLCQIHDIGRFMVACLEGGTPLLGTVETPPWMRPATGPEKAKKGTIRADFCREHRKLRNAVHGFSDGDSRRKPPATRSHTFFFPLPRSFRR